MVDHTGKLRCTLTCWGVGLMAGAVGTVMLGVIGGIGWNGAVFLGVLMFLALGLLLSIVLCRPLPTMAEVRARHGINRAAAPAPAQEGRPAAQMTAPAAPSVAVTTASPAVEAAAAPVAAPAAPIPEALAAAPAARPVEVHVEAAKSDPLPTAAGPGSIIVASAGGTKPAGFSAPLAGGADNLKEIKGVGPKLEQLLHRLGIYHFSQIAGWGPAEIAWMDDNLEGFRGRVTRDAWVEQARILSTGGETAFSQRVDDGDVYKDH